MKSSRGETAKKNQTPLGYGCGFHLFLCALTCIFLVINSYLVATFYPAAAQWGPEILRKDKVGQLLIFTLPVLITLVQWRLVDFLSHRLQGRKERTA